MTAVERHSRRVAQALVVAFLAAVLGLIAGFVVAKFQSERADKAEGQEAAAVEEKDATREETRDLLAELLEQCETGPATAEGRALCARAGDTAETIDNGEPLTVTGTTGDTGAAGADGDDGSDGGDGSDGARGARGAAGRPGTPGATGDEGPPGPAGADGTDGADGQDGTDGGPGPAGPEGATGAEGPAGPPGADGQDGAPCPEGSTLTPTTILTAEGPVDAFVCRADPPPA